MRKNYSEVTRIRPAEVDPKINKEILQKYQSDYDLIGKLAEYNAGSLERFKTRRPSVDRPSHGLMSRLKNCVIGTPLETPTRFIIKTLKRSRQSP
jgi:hypothetical protein